MTDDHHLHGLDPYDLLDAEAARLAAHFATLDDLGYAQPSRCEGWSVRDVLCHLASSEEYHHACLEKMVQAFFAAGTEKGLDSLEAWNDDGIRTFDGVDTVSVLEQWRTRNAETRRGFRAADGGNIDTSIGDYPGRWQAFHVALELATHADDVGVPVDASERRSRTEWRAGVSRFALAESKPDLTVERMPDGRTRIAGQGRSVEVDDSELVEAVAARLDDTSRLDEAGRALLSATP